jgi:hypothetical protein
MLHSVNSNRTRMVRNMILMQQSMEVVGRGSSAIGFRYSTVQTSSRRGSLGVRLMLQSANGNKPRVIRNTMLKLQSVEVVRQGLSGIEY